MSKLIFKPEMYRGNLDGLSHFAHGLVLGKKKHETIRFEALSADEAANQSQYIFNKWLSEQGLVYGEKHGALGFSTWHYDSKSFPGITHQARIVCIEEIKKCEHKNVYQKISPISESLGWWCYACKKPLKIPVFEDVDE